MPKTHLSNGEFIEGLGLPNDILEKISTTEGTEYEKAMNEFLTPLVNKIVYQKVESMEQFDNPFKQFDGYMIPFGSTIENIFVELPQGYTFDKDDENPFKKYIPSVKSLYVSSICEMQYPITLQNALMKRAVFNPNGLESLATNILNTLEQRKVIDEYSATIAMLNNKDIYANAIETLPLWDADSTDEDKAKSITQKIIDVVKDFQIPSKDNNRLHVLQTCSKRNVVLIIKQSLKTKLDMDYLANVWNLDKVALMNNIIEVRDFRTIEYTDATKSTSFYGEDIDFMIVDANGFDNHVALEDSGMIYNPKGKYTNHFTNLWKITAYKLFHNARAFKILETEPSKRTLTLTPTLCTITCKVNGQVVEAGANKLHDGEYVEVNVVPNATKTLSVLTANGVAIENNSFVKVSGALTIVATCI